LKSIQSYARVCTTLARSSQKILLQTQVDATIGQRFDALAKRNGHKRASYLRFVVEKLVDAAKPKHEDKSTKDRQPC
jgi:hypothetical protein